MIGTLILVAGLLVSIAAISGVLAAFIVHGYLWDDSPGSAAAGASGVAGALICALLAFGMLWTVNPDPSPPDDRPTVGGTATMTGMSALLWLPLYLYAFTGISRQRRRDAR